MAFFSGNSNCRTIDAARLCRRHRPGVAGDLAAVCSRGNAFIDECFRRSRGCVSHPFAVERVLLVTGQFDSRVFVFWNARLLNWRFETATFPLPPVSSNRKRFFHSWGGRSRLRVRRHFRAAPFSNTLVDVRCSTSAGRFRT